MERLTKKGKRTSYRPDYPKRTTTDCIKKLGQLEDLFDKYHLESISQLEKYIKLGLQKELEDITKENEEAIKDAIVKVRKN